VAYKYEFPEEGHLVFNEFSGGKRTVVKLLTNLGFKITEKTIVDSIIEAFSILKKESSIEEIKNTIIKNNFYDFGATNINDVIRTQIERHCENVYRKKYINNEKYFIKIDTNVYKYISYTVIVENDISQWEDSTGILYHFPKSYTKFLQPGTKVIYYKGLIKDKSFSEKRLSNNAHYFATAEIKEIIDDPKSTKNDKYARIENYKPFGTAVLAKQENQYLEYIPESKKNNYWRNGVRPISLNTYLNIISQVNEYLNLDKKIFNYKYQYLNDIEVTLESAKEGKEQKRYISTYERHPKLRESAIKIHGLKCKICDFDFEKTYGEHGKEYIQIHHTKPLHKQNKESEVSINDLVPVCANCHVMIHRKKHNTLSIDQMKKIYNKMK